MSAQNSPAPGQTSVVTEMTEDQEYQAWVESMAKHCHCSSNRPCDGILAGGLCDDIQDEGRIFDEADEP